jgi:hypothetical protein
LREAQRRLVHAVAALNAMLVYAQELQADRGEGLPFRAGE